MKVLLVHILASVLLFFTASDIAVAADESPADELETVTASLAGARLKDISDIIGRMEQLGGERVLPALNALLNGNLYYRRDNKQLVIGEEDKNDRFTLLHPLTTEVLGEANDDALRKIRIHNRLRIQLREVIARLTLFSQSSEKRAQAVRSMIENPDTDNKPLLLEARKKEDSSEIIKLIDLALALNDIQSDEQSVRLAALDVMQGSLEPTVRNAVDDLLRTDDEGKYLEQDKRVVERAQQVRSSIEGKIELYGFLEQFFFGLSLGSVLLLVATGLAITFGVMGVINMAHGELIMLGAYTTYVIQQMLPNHIEQSVIIAIPVAFLVSGAVGVVIERGVIQFLKGRPLETLLATFGISLILQQTVRTIFSPLNRQVETPMWMSGSLEINSVLSITYNRLYILIFALLVFLVLQLVLKKTPLGLHVRAVSQNRSMAKAIGIRTEWVDAMTFGLGSGIAGVAGVALSQLTNVGPNLGQAYIIDSFMVVVFGGVGNLWGTLVGGFSLGIANKFLEPVTGAVLANIVVLVFIILFIQKRPRGLFPQKGRAAE